MPKPKGSHVVITAALTRDGAPAYRRSDGSWSTRLAEAETIPAEDTGRRDTSLNEAMRQEDIVCDPYFFHVELRPDGSVDPLSARETIRSKGPTVPVRRPDR